MSHSILIVEDDLTFATMLKTWLGKKGFSVDTASSNARARKQLDAQSYDLVLSDLRLPDQDGIFLLSWMKEHEHNAPLIIMTGYADIQSAVQAMKHGASDYISKPVQPDELLKKINEALSGTASGSVSAPASVVTEQPSAPPKTSKHTSTKSNSNTPPPTPSNFLEGESEAARQLYNYVGLVAPTPMSVLINGASGTGKEYVAHRIHQLSKRANKPFIAIDCGSIPKELAASEFFGHVKGSFTGALNDKTGAFVEANGGTLFLDEIGNLSYEVQIQLLRALQERRVRPVGSNKEIEVDVRLVSATNENLQQAIKKGTFREDLYHRINEFTLRMPALRERQEDILLFANFFLDQANRELDRQLIGFDTAASHALQSYSWPGNLRQLKNIVKRATLLAQGNFITLTELGYELQEPGMQAAPHTFSLHDEAAEKKRILDALKQTGNNKSKAAILLGIDRKTLYNKLKLYDIQ
ncbi:sigma-54-dependent transcriptional regulator [Phocaeicola sp.]